MIKPFTLSLSFLIGTAQAQHLMDPSQILEISIAKEGMTRISIEKEGIEDIFAFPQEFADNVQQHKSGHVFVVADGMEGPLFVTLITKRGIAQDIKLTPTAKKAEPILLKYETPETKALEEEQKATEVLNTFIQGMIPTGFYEIRLEEASRSGGPLTATVEKAYQNAYYRVIVYVVTTETSLSLDNRLLWDARDFAASFDQAQLEEGQEAKLYVIQKI